MPAAAAAEAAKIARLPGGNGTTAAIPSFIRADFADATQYVPYTMAVIMARGRVRGANGSSGITLGVASRPGSITSLSGTRPGRGAG